MRLVPREDLLRLLHGSCRRDDRAAGLEHNLQQFQLVLGIVDDEDAYIAQQLLVRRHPPLPMSAPARETLTARRPRKAAIAAIKSLVEPSGGRASSALNTKPMPTPGERDGGGGLCDAMR
jgi:hypothetical protein